MYPTLQILKAVDLSQVPILSRDRCIPRKEQAALARKLFRSLGLKGFSFTAPRFSMAQAVHVELPAMPALSAEAFVLHGKDYSNHCYADMPLELPAKQARVDYHEAERITESILNAAFPEHVDRSELESDYFDYCWSIH